MQPCSVEIEFYRPDRIFRTGESVQGWVRVTALRNITCRGLHINGSWRTTGSGNATQKNYVQQTLFQGTWTQGQKYEYPFEINPPLEPLSYQGKLINIDHSVSARADVTWAQPPQATQSFQWCIGTEVDEVPSNNTASAIRPTRWRLMIAAVLAVSVVLLAIQYSWALLALGILPMYLAGFFSSGLIANRIIRAANWVVPQVGSPQEAYQTELRFQTLGPLKPRRISAKLLGYEIVAAGSEDKRRTYQHTLHQEAAQVELHHENGNQFRATTSTTIPQTDAYSLKLLGNQISWAIELRVHLPLGLKRTLRREFLVRPKALAALTIRDGESNPNPAFETRTFFDLLKVTKELDVQQSNLPQSEFDFDKPYAVVLDVKQMQETAADWSDVEFASGTTLVGNLPGSTTPVRVLLPSSETQQGAASQANRPRIEQWTGTAVIAEFCNETKALILLAV